MSIQSQLNYSKSWALLFISFIPHAVYLMSTHWFQAIAILEMTLCLLCAVVHYSLWTILWLWWLLFLCHLLLIWNRNVFQVISFLSSGFTNDDWCPRWIAIQSKEKQTYSFHNLLKFCSNSYDYTQNLMRINHFLMLCHNNVCVTKIVHRQFKSVDILL